VHYDMVTKIVILGKLMKVCLYVSCCRYQNELPKKIKARGKDAHLIHEELVQTMKWKQTVSKHILLLWYCSSVLAIVLSQESLSGERVMSFWNLISDMYILYFCFGIQENKNGLESSGMWHFCQWVNGFICA